MSRPSAFNHELNICISLLRFSLCRVSEHHISQCMFCSKSRSEQLPSLPRFYVPLSIIQKRTRWDLCLVRLCLITEQISIYLYCTFISLQSRSITYPHACSVQKQSQVKSCLLSSYSLLSTIQKKTRATDYVSSFCSRRRKAVQYQVHLEIHIRHQLTPCRLFLRSSIYLPSERIARLGHGWRFFCLPPPFRGSKICWVQLMFCSVPKLAIVCFVSLSAVQNLCTQHHALLKFFMIQIAGSRYHVPRQLENKVSLNMSCSLALDLALPMKCIPKQHSNMATCAAHLSQPLI